MMKTVNQQTTSVMGIDVSKDKLDICYDHNGMPCSVVIENTSQSIHRFLKNLSTKGGGLPSWVVMEYTGGYEKLAHKLFLQADLRVHLAHPLRVHYFAKQKGYFAKTDKIDAQILREYGFDNEVKPSAALAVVDEELKELATRRGQLVAQLTAEKYRFKPHLTAVMKRSIQRLMKWLEKEIAQVEDEINKRIEQDATKKGIQQRLATFKGVGNTLANGLICALPELGALNRAEIACLVGVAPRNKDSGTARGRRMISGGRFYIRKLLYMAALVAIRYNTRMKDYYQCLKARGKESKVALTAVMRKIIITLNAMLKNQQDWNENRTGERGKLLLNRIT